MTLSPLLQLPYLQSSQAQKHVTMNDALRMLDALVQIAALDKDAASPPASPSEGDRYLVPASATGDWSGQDDNIAAYQDAAWAFFAPQAGWRAHLIDEAKDYVWTGTAWTADVQMDQLGVNTAPDAANRLAVASPATLLNHVGAGH